MTCSLRLIAVMDSSAQLKVILASTTCVFDEKLPLEAASEVSCPSTNRMYNDWLMARKILSRTSHCIPVRLQALKPKSTVYIHQ